MADKYTKVASPAVESPAADAWKDLAVEKEHQPAKVKSNLTYRQLEQHKASQEAQKASCEDRIAEIVAEMAKVKAAAEKE
tara:strand:- start:610 stop:849 length:240 start_codon:yes stop_codon:yes gene_type:complete